jgi:hypothetical protein
LKEWCEAADEVVNGHDLKVLSGSHDHLVAARDKVAEVVPTHYASEEHVAHIPVSANTHSEHHAAIRILYMLTVSS